MSWRLLDTGAGTPAWNMALDEALLERFAGEPLLRLYRWSPAALSLGRFQPLDEVLAVPAAVPRVRRITGGGALHHREDELTYAIVAPYEAFDGGKRAGPRVAYHAVHDAIRAGLATLGLALAPATPGATSDPVKCAPLCYDRATDFDLKAGEDRKLVGSAQRRRGTAFLQHGSIPASRDPYSIGAISVEELLGRRPSVAELARAVVAGFERSLGVAFADDRPTEDELARARALETERYGQEAWTRER